MAEFKKASDDFQESVRTEMKEVEKSTGVDELKKLSNFDPMAPEQGDAPKQEPEQSPEVKPEEKKAGEAKQNV
jgi:hypothetical protein